MPLQRAHVTLLFWSAAAVSAMRAGYATWEDEEGFELCVTSRRRTEDLSGMNMSHVPLNLPNTTQLLDISYNPLKRLDGAPLHRLSQLCFLKAAYCGLKALSPGTFDCTPGLKVLNISHNYFSRIPDLSLPLLKVLDLVSNLYNVYQLPPTFKSLTSLDVLYLGSENALQVNKNDFATLSNFSLEHLALGEGVKWRKYDRGALAELKSVRKITLNVPFCENFSLLENLLKDLNETQTKEIRFVGVLPDSCNVIGDPFRNLITMPALQNLTIQSTLINSSFMETFLKNILLSPISKIKFSNITYSEDTPDGFQFSSPNCTINIHSVIFDGVNHHQYKYPTINISVDIFFKMTYLRFSGTGMNILPCNLISALPSLETLDLSDNLLSDTGFWWETCSYTSVFPKLRHLSLSKNRFMDLSFISHKVHQMKNLKVLDLSYNSIILNQICKWPAHLTELSLSNNYLDNNVFFYLSHHFERIDLSKTGITVIDPELLQPFLKLTHLFLTSNGIKVIPEDLYVPNLLSLYVDDNGVTSISQESLAGLPRLQTLKAGYNPFSCSCDSYWFLTSLNKSLLPDWPSDYTCSTPPSRADLPMSEYKPSKFSCEVWLQATVAVPLTVAVTAAFCFVFYICDGVWYTKMFSVWIRVKRRGKKQANLLKNATYRYHSFISYSHADSSWVTSQLLPSLEKAGLSLCIHERDFVPGEWVVDNIINCVEASYKTLFVLSNHFVQSEWCNYELFFAQHRAIDVQQDSLVFILLEPIPTNSLPKKFIKLRRLLRQQTYLEWPKDELKQQVFWASLKSMLQVADNSIIVRDAARALSEILSEALPLISDEV